MEYLAHKVNEHEQTLREHLRRTSNLAGAFAETFDAGQFTQKVALFHDIGKYSEEFQKRIRGANIHVDHSTAGAKLLYESSKNALGLVAAYCISGHHGGLPDGGSRSQPQEGELFARLKKAIPDFSAFYSDLHDENLDLEVPKTTIKNGFQVSVFTRMVYSCLVDADWLDTEQFVSGEKPRGRFEDIGHLWEIFDKSLEKYKKPKDKLNMLRTEILHNCLHAAEKNRSLYTLTAPTGSGKTISSMAFALRHAKIHGKKRVIYIVPYNTIIEQNAGVFEKMLGTENILQHHSGVAYSNEEDSPEYTKLLATENWDAPIIVTSSVRFFESLFANSPSACRKLHNIANSVLIFDEAQMIPLPYLIPCVETIKELITNYRCSAVLATATQSSLNAYLKPLDLDEIVERPKEMYEAFKRVTFDCSLGMLSDDDLSERLKRHRQVLCIVNTRRKAQSLAKKIDGAFHLSTTMYPLHRSVVLSDIRKRLANNGSCIVVSTSLIEAGVDIDFPVVYREKAGLDSIIQAAGRCNRENKRDCDGSFVFVFESENEPNGSIGANVAAYEHSSSMFNDISSLEAIRCYFQHLRYIIGKENLDRKSVIRAFVDGAQDGFSLPFDQVAKSFSLIEENAKTVYVLIMAPDLAARIRQGEHTRELFRTLQQYTVSLHQNDFYKMEHLFEHIDEEISLLTIKEFYNEKTGIDLEREGGVGLFF